LTYCRITSPISGKIGLRLVDPGNIIHATDANGLAVITQLQPIAVVFNLAEDHLPEVLQDMKSDPQLRVDAFDRDFSHDLGTGKLLALDSQIDQTTGTVRLKAEFPNQDNALFPNQFVNVKMLVGVERDAVLVPAAAIQRSTLQGNFVYVIKADGTADSRPVKVGTTQGDSAAISSGLQPGDLVVIDGVDKLQPGSRVQVELASNRAAKPSGQ
jgi:membrane fusion protein, multidrug efflux system